jgi:tRNA-intron endonuclease, archaea type
MSKKDSIIKTYFSKEIVLTEASNLAIELNNTYHYGTLYRKQKVQLSLVEALYLLEKEKIVILNERNKEYTFDSFFKKAQKLEKRFWINYLIFKDFREKGYIIKTALKFGAEFRVYDRGIKPGQDHAKWVVFPVSENDNLTWHEFSAKNRVAHSTKKRLLIAVVDAENDITYYEIKWSRP